MSDSPRLGRPKEDHTALWMGYAKNNKMRVNNYFVANFYLNLNYTQYKVVSNV